MTVSKAQQQTFLSTKRRRTVQSLKVKTTTTTTMFWKMSLLLLLSFCCLIPGCMGQSLYISQICPTNKHHLLQLIPSDNDADPPIYQIYEPPPPSSSSSSSQEPYQEFTVNGNEQDDNNSIELFRECSCPRPTGHPTPIACPLDSRFCAVPTDLTLPVMCYAEDASVMVVRNIWPLMCLWYLCFILFVCCSYKGRQAVLYCLSKCFPNLNQTLVDRMLQRQRRQWTLNFWHAARTRNLTTWNSTTTTTNNNTTTDNASPSAEQGIINQDNDDETNHNEPIVALELKTKVYQVPEEILLQQQQQQNGNNNNNNNTTSTTLAYEEDDFCCTICFVPLEQGDRIGDLSCNHIFHVDCLKTWVQRKNSCPLCAIPLATKRGRQRHQQWLLAQQQQNHQNQNQRPSDTNTSAMNSNVSSSSSSSASSTEEGRIMSDNV